MLYIDTSSLMKLLGQEAESERTRQRVATEQKVVLSSLTELEADVQLAGACLAGKYSWAKLSAYRRALSAFPEIDPFERTELPGELFRLALRQQRRASEPHCGTLDRLHLAAMEWLGQRQEATLLAFAGDAYLNEMGITNRFFTTDLAPDGNQALLAAAEPLGYSLSSPNSPTTQLNTMAALKLSAKPSSSMMEKL